MMSDYCRAVVQQRRVQCVSGANGSACGYIYHKHHPSVGKYTIPMDPLGINIYIYAYMHTCMHTYIHTDIHTYLTLPYLTSHHITSHHISLHHITLHTYSICLNMYIKQGVGNPYHHWNLDLPIYLAAKQCLKAEANILTLNGDESYPKHSMGIVYPPWN